MDGESKMLGNRLLHYAKTDYVYYFIVYLILAMVIFYPITLHMNSTVPGSGGDTYQSLWGIWWVSYSTFVLHTSLWHTSLLYYPIGANLVYETFSPLLAILSAPFQSISIPFAYDLMFFFGFAISGIGMYVLAKYLIKNSYAAFFAGLVFSFSAAHVAQSYAHIQWMAIGFVPLSLYFLLTMMDEGNAHRMRSSFWLGLSFVFASFMGGIEEGIMIIVVILMAIVYYLVIKERRALVISRKFVKYSVFALIVAFALGSWGFIPILHVVANPSQSSTVNQYTLSQSSLWSDNILSFFVPSYYNGIFNNGNANFMYGIYETDPTEQVAFVGYAALILALYGLYKERRNRAAIAFAFAAIFFVWLAMGPYLKIGATITSIPGIYVLYHALPGFNVFREPGRFDMIAMMFVGLLAAYGIMHLYELKQLKSDRTKRIAAVAILSFIFLIGSVGMPLNKAFLPLISTHVHASQFYADIGKISGNFSILALPALPNPNSVYPALYPGLATYDTVLSHKPIVEGYITRSNETEIISMENIPLIVQASNLQTTGSPSYPSPIIENYTNETIMSLFNYNTDFITLDTSAYNGTGQLELEHYLGDTFGNPIYSGNSTLAYSTKSTIESRIYRSYVAYPFLPEWAETTYPINGTDQSIWVPFYLSASEPPRILVYAPYPNGTNVTAAINSPVRQYINTDINITAMSLSHSVQNISVYTLTSSNSYLKIASFNVTPHMQAYTIPVKFVSGPIGNPLFLVGNYGSNGEMPVAITGISFNKAN